MTTPENLLSIQRERLRDLSYLHPVEDGRGYVISGAAHGYSEAIGEREILRTRISADHEHNTILPASQHYLTERGVTRVGSGAFALVSTPEGLMAIPWIASPEADLLARSVHQHPAKELRDATQDLSSPHHIVEATAFVSVAEETAYFTINARSLDHYGIMVRSKVAQGIRHCLPHLPGLTISIGETVYEVPNASRVSEAV